MKEARDNPAVAFGRAGRVLFTAAAMLILITTAVLGFIRETNQFPAILLGLATFVATLLVPVYSLGDRAGWFHPLIFTSGFSLLQIVRRATSYFDGMSEHAGIPGFSLSDLNALIWQLLLIQVLAQFAYYLGYSIGPKKSPSSLVAPRADVSFRLVALIAVVGLLFVTFLRNKGGLEEHLLDLGKGRVRQIEETQLFGVSVVVVNLAMFAMLCLVAMARTSTHYLLLAVTAPAVLFMKYTVAGSRSSMIFALILSLMVRSIATGRIRWTSYILGAVIAIIAIGALGQIRRGTWKGSEGLSGAMDSLTATDALLGGATELEQRGSALNPVYPIMARVPNEIPYLLGQSYITLITAPIPRAVWINKPRTTGALVGQTFFDSDAGMPPGPIGEALWNFGLPGVVFTYMLFGAFHRLVFAWFSNSPTTPVCIVIYCLTLLNLQPDVLSIITWLQVTLAGYIITRVFGIVEPSIQVGGRKGASTQSLTA